MPPLASVIIPAYNAARKIGATCASVVAQDCTDIEIIVVDDASADDTQRAVRDALDGSGRAWKICAHEKNRGVSAARNTAIAEATGKYILFVDADDLTEPNYVSALAATADRENADIACCGHTVLNDDTGARDNKPIRLNPPTARDAEAFARMFLLHKFESGIWSTIFRANFIRDAGILFHEGCSAGEDVEFMTKAYALAEQIAYTSEPLYIYRHHDDMGSRREMDTFDKKIRRYRENTEAHFRAARFLAEHARYAGIRDIGENLLLPEATIRQFTILARTGAHARFTEDLANPEIRATLRRSKKYLREKPEVFMKAQMLLWAPRFYYWLRGR